jgi:hypothetical protein
MHRCAIVALLLATLSAGPAHSNPGIAVRYDDEVLRVTLDGSYAGIYYQVWRSADPGGRYAPLSYQLTLCTGDCYLTDRDVTPGQTYFYRFDLHAPDGTIVSFGPYPVSVPDHPVAAQVWPNPSRGPARVDLSLPGSTRRDAPVRADARVLDLQGRTVRLLFEGPLSRGVTSLTWDGRGDSGRLLDPGVYFLRLKSALGTSTTRVIRWR